MPFPTDIHNTTLNIEGLYDLREYLIKVFESPRVKKAYGQSTSQEATEGAFSMEKFVEDYTTEVNSNDMRKFIFKVDSLQTSFQTLQNRGPYNPEVTPHRGRHSAKPYDCLLISGNLMLEKISLSRLILEILGSNLMTEVGEDSKETFI